MVRCHPGFPKGGYGYAQVITPGYKLFFDINGALHAVHTNSGGSHMVTCEDGQQDWKANRPPGWVLPTTYLGWPVLTLARTL